jgi:putative endonuclease
VEVKLRSEGAIALPREFVDQRKQERLRRTAESYLTRHEIDAPARFDVAEVYLSSAGVLRIEYLENAFY